MAGPDRTTVRLALPDRAGTLRVVHTEGPRLEGGRRRSNRRRDVFRSLQATTVELPSSPGTALLLVPLAVDGTALGVVEVVGPSRRLSLREAAIRAAADLCAEALYSARQVADAARTARALRGLVGLTADLLKPSSAAGAVRIAATLCSDHLGAPVVGVIPDEDRRTWAVAATPGLGSRRHAEVVERIRAVPARASVRRTRERLASAFADACGIAEVEAVGAGGAFLLVPSVDAEAGFVSTVAFLLARALEHRSEAALARSRNDALDLGIAWTAHELQAPLIGARTALSRVLEEGEWNGSAGLLARTRDELRELAELVDPLLRWSAGTHPLERTEVDLVRLVEQVVASCTLATADERVTIQSPSTLFVWADGRELRTAIANLVRNALAYAPPESPVAVRVRDEGDTACVYVEDQGPGIPSAEREVIFDPFARGTAGRSRRAGRGLGLFVAQRVVEAHGGVLTLEPSTGGSVFRVEIPIVDEEGSERSAS